MRCREEESVRRHQPAQRLVWPSEVVRLDEEAQPSLAISEVGEDGAREKLFPQRLPEALDLPQRHRVLRAAANVADAVLPECLLEGRLAAPRRVLPPVVGQHFLRRPIRRDAAFERLEHQRGFVVMRQHVRHHKARVVVEERRHVELLVASQPEFENVRLPHLVRRRALEASLRRRPLRQRRRLRRQQPFLVQNSPHLRLGNSERLEASQAVRNFAAPEVCEGLLHRHHRFAPRVGCLRFRLRACLLFSEAGLALLLVPLHPLVHRVFMHPEYPRQLANRCLSLEHLLHHAQFELGWMVMTRRASGLAPLRFCLPSHLALPFRSAGGLLREGRCYGFSTQLTCS